VVAVAATKTIQTRCEGDSGKRCHDEIRPEPQCWRDTAGFCISLLEGENARLKKLLAEALLDTEALKAALGRKH
jgi:hypothetical protein